MILKIGTPIVEIISTSFLKIYFSWATITDENTLIGKEIAVLKDMIKTNIFIFSISFTVSPLLKKKVILE